MWDEGKVITVTNPFLYNSLPPHQSSAPCGLDDSFSAQGRSLRLRGSLLDWKRPTKSLPLGEGGG